MTVPQTFDAVTLADIDEADHLVLIRLAGYIGFLLDEQIEFDAKNRETIARYVDQHRTHMRRKRQLLGMESDHFDEGDRVLGHYRDLAAQQREHVAAERDQAQGRAEDFGDDAA